MLRKDVFYLKMKTFPMPGVVVHACNPSTWEVEVGEVEFEASLGCMWRPCLKKRKQPPHTLTFIAHIKPSAERS
jgi:hypothetical protein